MADQATRRGPIGVARDWLVREWRGVPAAIPAKQITELKAEVAMLREASADFGYDPDANLSAAGGGSAYHRRLTQTTRDLPEVTADRARELGVYLYETNPLGKRILEIVRDFCLGEGVTVASQAKDDDDREAQQAVIDRFWQDPVNTVDIRLYDRVLELGLFGEACWPVAVNPANGHVRWGYVDPGQVADVVCDPLNHEIAREIVLKAATGTERKRLKVIRRDENPGSPTYGRLMGVRIDRATGQVLDTYREDEQDKPYAGACFWWAINKPSAARRGRGDLLAVADWLDSLDQLLFNEVDRNILAKSFIWDVTLTGETQPGVDKWLETNNKAPKPGSVRAHNDKVAWIAVTPDLKMQDAQTGADMILSYIAAGAGVPKHWLSGTIDVNKATATEMGEPAFKRLTSRQKLVRFILEQVVTFVLDQAEVVGGAGLDRRDKLEPEAWPIVVQAPEIRSKDLKAGADTLNAAATALATARADGVIDQQVQQEAFALLLAQIGVDVDMEAMRQRIEAEEAERDAQMAAMMRQPTPNGNGHDDEDDDPVANGNGRYATVARGKARVI